MNHLDVIREIDEIMERDAEPGRRRGERLTNTTLTRLMRLRRNAVRCFLDDVDVAYGLRRALGTRDE